MSESPRSASACSKPEVVSTSSLSHLGISVIAALLLSIAFSASREVLGQTPTIIYGVTTSNNLVSFSSANPSSFGLNVPITGLQPGENILGIDFRPATGELYALGSTNRVYIINPSTGGATQLGSPGTFTLSGTEFGFDFNPVLDRIRVTSDADQNLRLNPNNGALASTDTTLAYAAGDPNAVHNPNVVASGYTNNFAGTAATTLYDIDSNLDILVLQGGINGSPSPNGGQLTTVGSLGVNVSAIASLDILTGSDMTTNTAFAALNPNATTSSNLYTINLSTGAATLVGTIGGVGGPIIRGITIQRVTPIIYGVTTSNNLVSFSSANPSSFGLNVPITGLQPGENILGIDFRPATGQLYALGSTNRLYVINPGTGSATQFGNAGGFTLIGTEFGFDFNPVPDRIRVTSDADQNLRLNPNDGTLAGTDTTLAYAAGDPNAGHNPNVVASGYTNNFAGTASTTLYDIDSNLDILVLQGGINGSPSANGGQLTTVGPLGVNTSDIASLDILTGSDMTTDTAFAALNPNATTSSNLYTINLSTGAATLVGTIGGTGGPIIRGIAIQRVTLPSISINDLSQSEGNSGTTNFNFTVSLSNPTAQTVTVNYATASGTATAGSDYQPIFTTLLSFSPLQTSRTVTVSVNGDTTIEPDETFFVNLSGAIGATIADSQGIGTIQNDDGAPQPGTVQFSAAAYNQGEGGETATITVTRTGGSSGAASVQYATATGGTATGGAICTTGVDYVTPSGTLNWTDGDASSKTFFVTICNDSIFEGNQTVNLALSNATGATLGSQTSATLTINDDDTQPTISINDVTQAEGNSAASTFNFTVSLTNPSTQTVTVNYATANGTATAGSDYQPIGTTTLSFSPLQTSRNLIVFVNGDTTIEPDETFFVNLSGATNATIADAQGLGTIQNDDVTVQFSSAAYSQGEGAGHVDVTVTRTGDTANAFSVDYRTTDTDTFTVGCSDTVHNLGGAYGRCDYSTSVDTLNFLAGETTKTFAIPIIDDSLAEGNETFSVVLSNATGASLGTPATATITIFDNETVTGANPIFTTPFFVREHYLDFLSREPEVGEPWTAVLNNCSDVNNNPLCDRLTVSAAFFGSPEFQLKGYFVYRFYKLAFNRLPTYPEIVTDMRAVTGQTPAEVFQKKAAFSNAFVQRAEFASSYGALLDGAYVSALMARYSLAQITTPDPAAPDGTIKVTLTTAQLTAQLNGGTLTRAQVLRAIADSDQVASLEFNQAFVAMQYYGYLRRAPETAGYNSWLTYLNTHPNDSRTMVNGFMNSAEYRLRFGPSQ